MVAEPVALAYFRAKINSANLRSISLFKSIGFEQYGEPSYFGEVELRWSMNQEALQKLEGFEEPKLLEYTTFNDA